MKISFQAQHDEIDCGPSCLKMVSSYYGRKFDLNYLRDVTYLNRNGVSLLSLNDAAENLGFKTKMVFITLDRMVRDRYLPCILHWNQNHFVVLYRIKVLRNNRVFFTIADPKHGIITVDRKTIENSWISVFPDKGTALLLEPTAAFYHDKNNANSIRNKNTFHFLIPYLRPYKQYFLRLSIGLIVTSGINLTFPFLTQILVDFGITEKNISIVYLILISQIFLFIGSISIEIIQNWILLFINARVSLNIISDFLIKLFNLPIKFFDSKSIGDITQRIHDHNRIELFLTSTLIVTLMAMINTIVFATVLNFYSLKIFLIFFLFTLSAITWFFFFQKKRKQIDYKRFNANKENQDKLYEIIVGMPEIKLYGGEKAKRWDWERLQIKLFNLNIKSLSLEQFQRTGYLFFLETKNIIISFVSAFEVINRNYSVGTMLGIAYIVGQTNGPLGQLMSFFRVAQDAKLSLERMGEIHDKESEEEKVKGEMPQNEAENKVIRFNKVNFQYSGLKSKYVLKNINLTINVGKITAIVGTSGSGKTTLIKLLLKFYDCTSGDISLGNRKLKELSSKGWRRRCGTVMQDGLIFSDTILRNIILSGEKTDRTRLEEALYISNLDTFVASLPNGLATKVGSNGNGLSGGQKQRLLIARAVYKNPDFIFFDEATSSLDSINEKIIMERLNTFFVGKTVLIIAHRLSTVKSADMTIVLQNGEVVETGSHADLLKSEGYYFHLVQNQLEFTGYEN